MLKEKSEKSWNWTVFIYIKLWYVLANFGLQNPIFLQGCRVPGHAIRNGKPFPVLPYAIWTSRDIIKFSYLY